MSANNANFGMECPGKLAYFDGETLRGHTFKSAMEACEYDWGQGNCQQKNNRNVTGGTNIHVTPKSSVVSDSIACKAPTSGGKKKTSQRVQTAKGMHVVYEGPRGGKYILQGGQYVPLRK